MQHTQQSKNDLLAKIGLKDKMIWKDPDDYIFDEGIFDRYVSEEYRNSARKETDEFYRMREIVLIHRLSGLRIEYVETENYFGDESEFKLRDIFIITLQGKRHAVENVDFLKQLFITPEGEITFIQVKKVNDGD